MKSLNNATPYRGIANDQNYQVGAVMHWRARNQLRQSGRISGAHFEKAILQ